jgi:hypothetical protein
MPYQGWQQVLKSSSVDGTQILNSVTQASIIPAADKLTLPAGFIDRPGQYLRIAATGRISNVVTTPGTLLFQVLFGAIVVFNSSASTIALNVAAKTNVTWWLNIELQVRTVGAGTAATMLGIGNFVSESVVSAPAGTAGTGFFPPSAPAVSTGFDSTVANVVDLQAKFSVATATTALTCHTFVLESTN